MTWVSPLQPYFHCPHWSEGCRFKNCCFLYVHFTKRISFHCCSPHLSEFPSELIRRSSDFICQGQGFDICNMWFSLLLMETGWVKCSTSGFARKHSFAGPRGCATLSRSYDRSTSTQKIHTHDSMYFVRSSVSLKNPFIYTNCLCYLTNLNAEPK